MDDKRLAVKKHIRYFDRYLGLVPASHQDMDVNKLVVIYYALCGQSILGETELQEKYPSARPTIRSMYHEHDTFAGFIPSKLMDSSNDQNFSLPNTLFGLLCSLLLEDLESLKTINKEKILQFVSKCQDKELGGFRSYVAASEIDPVDIRYSYIAVSIMHILGCRTLESYSRYINVKLLTSFLDSCYCHGTGGFSTTLEPHAGYTSCVAGIYHFLKIPCPYKEETITWLVHRQVSTGVELDHPNFDVDDHGGIQGRENKFSDTCYAFWCINSIRYFADGNAHLFDIPLVVDYLLDKTQDTTVGGFSKTNEDDSDIYHSFLGLAALGMISDTFDGYLSIPHRIANQLSHLL